ncbi:hypothetical protein HII36_27860 [Nonomuraea sp. NN258]|uniref:hypothetical protein n=1 Tax=Nonomuraea antri TaxID=2730852 RepID=UPI00156800E1|nr:hypothetical protein [Nonomuraea antri]NRQ35621.1 hypothetical protein [Nonomuraea antri]
MRGFQLPVALAALLLFAAACTTGEPVAPTQAPAGQPIADLPPYVCELVPEQALRLVSGINGPVTATTAGTKESGQCRAPASTPPPLQVNWLQADDAAGQEHLDFLMDDRRKLYSRHSPKPLPADLGNGMTTYLTNSPLADQPYRVSAEFRCGGEDRMIDIYLAQVVKGRDGIKDLIELMRIAQKRYGELYSCKLDA